MSNLALSSIVDERARPTAAELLTEVVERLYDPIAMLRTVWLALGNPASNDRHDVKFCLEVLESATDLVERLRKEMNDSVDKILGSSE
ncbi:hypothetical protein LAV84_21045 [Rhizobium sp. VS19-DR104.2]|uniref:hypothetical protein n=1 Tax=unclassified Rhizobium TaxID=2613769 RepID=UPI001CC502CD|nr:MULTISPECIES: hypothetical protein [unclassified Rhizobium]MBZ5761780.1 hypothetical protein [Rhizobium sp. VS19-DR96]MBZ5768026.1 hypothetical protein [Rhizobium sp. VS19-DR129.2]MBZ5775374.1 hypothetical protein [Rhizobium sp. VS19-DRK62.2]MBZ5786659.1 hypothetical protein [Rhizobium sp. VS19-DR121]MBZ5803815.1 hypothetical protein [Rhizobium sp. VS19-DR181]